MKDQIFLHFDNYVKKNMLTSKISEDTLITKKNKTYSQFKQQTYKKKSIEKVGLETKINNLVVNTIDKIKKSIIILGMREPSMIPILAQASDKSPIKNDSLKTHEHHKAVNSITKSNPSSQFIDPKDIIKDNHRKRTSQPDQESGSTSNKQIKKNQVNNQGDCENSCTRSKQQYIVNHLSKECVSDLIEEGKRFAKSSIRNLNIDFCLPKIYEALSDLENSITTTCSI